MKTGIIFIINALWLEQNNHILQIDGLVQERHNSSALTHQNSLLKY